MEKKKPPRVISDHRPTPPLTEKPADPPVSAADESFNSIPVPEPPFEAPTESDSCSAASFLEAVGSREQSGASLLGNLPAAGQSGEPLVIGRNSSGDEGEKASLLQSIAERRQDKDDEQNRE